VYDDWDGNDISEDDSRHADYTLPSGERFCGNTHIDNLCDVEHYGYVIQDHAIYSTELSEWIVDDPDYWLYSERDGRWYYADDVVTAWDGDSICHDDSVCLSNGEYAHYEDAVNLENDTWELTEDCVEVDGVWMLKSQVNNDNQ
jgi:hypothetical protein